MAKKVKRADISALKRNFRALQKTLATANKLALTTGSSITGISSSSITGISTSGKTLRPR